MLLPGRILPPKPVDKQLFHLLVFRTEKMPDRVSGTQVLVVHSEIPGSYCRNPSCEPSL